MRVADPAANTLLEYAPNVIVTSRYTVLNFIPKFLYEQFQRFVNLYFLYGLLGLSFASVSVVDMWCG